MKHMIPIAPSNQLPGRGNQVKDKIIQIIRNGARSEKEITFGVKNLKNKVCLSPFVTASVDLTGEVRLCGCTFWMETSIGNLYHTTLKEMLASPLAQSIRNSIANGTYVYCNEKACGVINNNELNDQTDPHSIPPQVKECLDDTTKFYMPREIVLAIDLTCNLSCPSCRNNVIKVDEESMDLYQDLGDRIRRNLFSEPTNDHMRLMLSTSGEVFASPMLLEMINTIPTDDYPNLSLVIQSNGLLAPERWHKLGNMQNRVDSIIVTIDAARSGTYEKLRRGGKWEDLLNSLSWLAEKKKQNGMKFVARMVVQKDNYQEMEEFWHVVQKFDVDHVEYVRILNWGTYRDGDYNDTFSAHDVFDPTHPDYHLALAMLNKTRLLPNCKFWGGL